jgi:hypothetical protein
MQGRIGGMLCILTMVGGCLGSGGGGSGGGGGSSGNQPPTITGVPPPATLRKEQYEFQPSASDPDGDRLRFSIRQKPTWAHFDKATGRLHGKPTGKDVGEYIDIAISVSDGRQEASLPKFSIIVYHSGDESATLAWLPPTENADGSVLTNLNGYYIYIGQTPDVSQRIIRIKNEGLTRYVVEKLYPSTWYFAMSAYNKFGQEGRRTPVVSKTID